MKQSNGIQNGLIFLKLCALSVLTGVLGGLVGAAFVTVLALVTNARGAAPWLILLLPLGSVATVLLYRVFKADGHHGTNEIIRNLIHEDKIRTIIAPLIFVSAAITHLLGGSAGREGAALQLGGAGSAAVSDWLKLKGRCRTVFVLCGMSATFAGVFGTPLTAAIFVLEFKIHRKITALAFLPCLISAVVAQVCASLLGITNEVMPHDRAVPFSAAAVGQTLVLAIALCLLGAVMCFVFKNAAVWARKILANAIVRAAVLAVAVVALTACVGDMRYNGAGMDMVLGAVAGNAQWYDFILKLVFTAVTLAAGLKGGEIVPTFCIGATFGCFFGGLLGMDVRLAAALGLIGLFCCVTHGFISAIVLGIELFGFAALPYVVILCVVIWLFSANNGLFENRVFTSPIWKKRSTQ